MGSELILWLARAILIILLFFFLLVIISIIRADLREKKIAVPLSDKKKKLPSRMSVARSTSENNMGEIALVGQINIGRASDNHVILRELTISSHHAAIKCSHDQVVVEDLNSTNGVLLNGIRIKESAELQIEDELQIGETVFIIE